MVSWLQSFGSSPDSPSRGLCGAASLMLGAARPIVRPLLALDPFAFSSPGKTNSMSGSEIDSL